MKPKELCDTYRAELARLYGEERARKSRVDYGRGWYYIKIARRFDDGSVGAIGPAPAYRRAQVIEMLENLREKTA